MIFYIWNVHNKIGDLYVFSAGLVGEAVTHFFDLVILCWNNLMTKTFEELLASARIIIFDIQQEIKV